MVRGEVLEFAGLLCSVAAPTGSLPSPSPAAEELPDGDTCRQSRQRGVSLPTHMNVKYTEEKTDEKSSSSQSSLYEKTFLKEFSRPG